MTKITNKSEMYLAILEKELEQEKNWLLLKQQINYAAEQLKPVNLIKSSMKDLIPQSGLKSDLVNAAIGMTTGFVAKKVLFGMAANPITSIVGSLVEMIVANQVSKNADGIKSVGKFIMSKFSKRKELQK